MLQEHVIRNIQQHLMPQFYSIVTILSSYNKTPNKTFQRIPKPGPGTECHEILCMPSLATNFIE